MNAFQKAKVEASLTLLKYLQALLSEAQAHCLKHRRENLTVCTAELVSQIADGEVLHVIRKKHTNKERVYEAKNLNALLNELISSLESELGVLGGRDAA